MDYIVFFFFFFCDMLKEDAQIIYNTYLSYNWHPVLNTYLNYFEETLQNKRKVFIAEYKGKVKGLCTLVLEPEEGPYGKKGIPEIVDLCVFFDKHNLGIGSKLLDTAESEAAKTSNMVYLGVGLHSGYGAAQRLYIKRGYIPDGSGVWWNGKNLGQYEDCTNDDELVLFLAKEL